MSEIEQAIRDEITRWEMLGAAKPLAHYVLRNGKHYRSAPYTGVRGEMKMCYSNAIGLALRSGFRYVEGFAVRQGLGILIDHAWCVDGDTVVDPTWDRPEEGHYFGIEYDPEEAMQEMIKQDCYGLFWTPMLNVDFLMKKDPNFKNDLEYGKSLKPHPIFQNQL